MQHRGHRLELQARLDQTQELVPSRGLRDAVNTGAWVGRGAMDGVSEDADSSCTAGAQDVSVLSRERPFGVIRRAPRRGARRSLERTRARACACRAFCRRRVPGRTRTPRAWTPPSRDAVRAGGRRPADCWHESRRKRRQQSGRLRNRNCRGDFSRFPSFQTPRLARARFQRPPR